MPFPMPEPRYARSGSGFPHVSFLHASLLNCLAESAKLQSEYSMMTRIDDIDRTVIVDAHAMGAE